MERQIKAQKIRTFLRNLVGKIQSNNIAEQMILSEVKKKINRVLDGLEDNKLIEYFEEIKKVINDI